VTLGPRRQISPSRPRQRRAARVADADLDMGVRAPVEPIFSISRPASISVSPEQDSVRP
jgi:hypothetical protein